MSKAAIQKKYQISAQGILVIEDGRVAIEDTEKGAQIDLADLFVDFVDRDVKLSITYGEEY